MLKNLSEFLRPFSSSTLFFSISNSTKFLLTNASHGNTEYLSFVLNSSP